MRQPNATPYLSIAALTAGFTVPAIAGLPAPALPAKPNVLFLLVDDMGYMDIGANNQKTFYETPNIDRLAAQGMRFTDGYVTCPVCTPTRASIMTGKYPQRMGITTYFLWTGKKNEFMPLEEVTVAEALRDTGYATFFTGKWHLGDGQYNPSAQGFPAGLLGQYYEYLPHNNDPKFPDPVTPVKPFAKDDPKRTDRLASDFIQFLNTRDDKPFFAYVAFQAVHCQIGARADLVAKYRRKQALKAPKLTAAELRQPGHQKQVQNDPVYAAMIEQLDSAIGRMMAALRAKGLDERTIVVFLSDNGGMSTGDIANTSNLPLRGGKSWLYEGGVREPFIIRAPGVTKPGSTCTTPVTSTDFYPTLLDLAGVPLLPKQHRDGMSLVPLLKGGSLERGPLFWHYPHHGGGLGGLPGGAVRDGDWKLIEWYETGRTELYNLKNDLGEKTNLATQNSDKVKELQAKLTAWRKEVHAVMPKSTKGNASKKGAEQQKTDKSPAVSYIEKQAS